SHIEEALKRERASSSKLQLIRELLEDGIVPDIRILAYGIEGGVNASVPEIIETVLISLFGRENKGGSPRDHFDERMGYPQALTNRAGSSTRVDAGSLASLGAIYRKDRDAIYDLDELIEEVSEYDAVRRSGIEEWITIGIS